MKQIAWILIAIISFAQGVPPLASAYENADSSCSVPRRSTAALIESVGTDQESTMIPDEIPYVAPTGLEADQETTDAVTSTAQIMVACVNAGDIVGFLSVMSDGFLRTYLSGMGFTRDDLEEPIEPMPVESLVSVIDVRDVTLLDDGRVAALMVLDQGELESENLAIVITFVSIDGRWRIDDWQPVTVAPEEEPVGQWQIVTTGEITGAVVPLDRVEEYMSIIDNDDIQGMWTPTDGNIAELERKLPSFLASSPNATPRLKESTTSHLRHYIGFVSEGKLFIMVNAFCGDYFESWSSEPIFVMDGGDCFFNVVYEPATATFSRLSVNGEA